MTEWLPVVGYEGRYEVSDAGEVRSLVYRTGRARSTSLTTHGYERVTLSSGHRAISSHHVHKLVMDAFVGPRPEGSQVRHLDGDKLNNRLANLAYGTQVENNLDIMRHGRNRNFNKTECPSGHPYDADNTYLRVRNGYTHRQCKTCNRIRSAAVARRKTAKAAA